MPNEERDSAGSISEEFLDRIFSEACKGWEGRVWRLHASRYKADDPGGSYRVSGRYNRGRDHFAEEEVFPALYLATAPEVCLGEKQRHLVSGNLPQMRNQVLSELQVRLQNVCDLSSPEEFGFDAATLMEDHNHTFPQSLGAALTAPEKFFRMLDHNHTFPQSLGAALRQRGAEAFLAPSATLLGTNLVVLPDRLREGSSLEVLQSNPTRLYVERPD